MGGEYIVELVDPDEIEGPRRVSVDFNRGAITEGYYGTLVEWLIQSDRTVVVERGGFPITVGLSGFDPTDEEFVYIGIVNEGLDSVRRAENPRTLESVETEDTYIGSDGIVIVTSRSPKIS